MELRKNDNDFIGFAGSVFYRPESKGTIWKLPKNAVWLYIEFLLNVDYVSGTIHETDYRGFLSAEKVSRSLRRFGSMRVSGIWDKKKSRRALKTLRYYGFITPVTIDGKQYYEIVNYYLHYYGECMNPGGGING